MEKFLSEKHTDLQQYLPFSYFNTNIYLDFAAYVFERNGESIVVWQDAVYPHEFPCIFAPKKKENWVHCSIALAAEEDVAAIQKEAIEILVKKPMGCEFFYKTDDFINLKGSFKSRVRQFASNYKYSLTDTADKKRIIDFYNFWKSQRDHTSITFEESEEFFNFCLDNLDMYGIRQIYVEADNKIIGLAWGIESPKSGNWIGLHLKVDYRYKGLSRFLHTERAKMFKDSQEFSLGTGAHDSGITQYKEELGPVYKKQYYYLLTGDRKD